MRFFASDWNSFWEEVWEGLKLSFSNLYKYWFKGSETEGPFLANFLLAITVLLIGWLIIKFVSKAIKKGLKIDKRIIKESTVKSFVFSTIQIVLYFGLAVLVLLILRVDLNSASQIFASATLAIGLSLQNVISNFASGIIILSNKPFVVGEYVSINNEVEGTVVAVKFLSTTLLTVDEQVVTIQNTSIVSGNIINYSRSPIRRLVVDVKVDYSQDIDQVKEILRSIAEKENRVLVDNGVSVVVTDFSENGVTVSLRCYTPNSQYWDVRFDVYEAVAKTMQANNIRVALKQVIVTDREKMKEEGIF